MKRARRTYILIVLLLVLAGCKGSRLQQELTKWQVSLAKDDKRPYGTYIAYQSMKYYFPGAPVTELPGSLRYTGIDTALNHNRMGRTLLVLQGLDFYLSDSEWESLKDFISNGNEVILFCRELDNKIEEELGHYKRAVDNEETPLTAVTMASGSDILTMENLPQRKFGYKGRAINGYFARLQKPLPSSVAQEPGIADSTGHDSGEPEVVADITGDSLGYAGDKVNFIRFGLGSGHLTLHAAPLVLSNYFLLQPGNDEYLAAMWHTLPLGITNVYWSDYYKRNAPVSGLSMLWRLPATRLALLLGMLTLLTYIIFEGKRKQRLIPVLPPLRNESVAFVETVGRLYYNKGDHANLAAKMVQQFQEWVRTHYYLNTNLPDEHFIRQLILKSGIPEVEVRGLMMMIDEVRTKKAIVDEPYLYRLYNTIQQFYKK